MSKRPHGSGSVYQRKRDGRWAACVVLSDGKRKTFYAASEEEAIRRMEEAYPDLPRSGGPRCAALTDWGRKHRVTSRLRFEVMQRDDFRCRICGRNADDGVKLTVDHCIPVAAGGQTIYDNLQCLCFPCNEGKGIAILIRDTRRAQRREPREVELLLKKNRDRIKTYAYLMDGLVAIDQSGKPGSTPPNPVYLYPADIAELYRKLVRRGELEHHADKRSALCQKEGRT